MFSPDHLFGEDITILPTRRRLQGHAAQDASGQQQPLRSLRRICSIIVLSLILFSAALFSFHSPAHAGDGYCSGAIQNCAAKAARFDLKLGRSIQRCQAVKSCGLQCDFGSDRKTKAKHCRAAKHSCKANCRAEYGRGKNFKQCASICKQRSRACTHKFKHRSSQCRWSCGFNHRTKACNQASRKIQRNSLNYINACAVAVSCIKSRKRRF